MRHAAFLVSTLLAFAGAAQATDWPQGSWCEVQRQNKDGVNPVTVRLVPPWLPDTTVIVPKVSPAL